MFMNGNNFNFKDRLLITPILFLLVTIFSCFVYAELPAEVRADLLQSSIVESIKSKKYIMAKKQLSEYRALGLAIPPTIYLIDAKVSIALKKYVAAKKSLEDYFLATGTKGKDYTKALNLYKKVEPAAAPEEAILKENKERALKKAKKIARGKKIDQCLAERHEKEIRLKLDYESVTGKGISNKCWGNNYDASSCEKQRNESDYLKKEYELFRSKRFVMVSECWD